MPDKSIDFIDGVFNLVVGVDGLDPQLKDQSVELVYDKSDLDALLKSVFDDLFCVHHNLEHRVSGGENRREEQERTPSRTSTTSRIPSTNLMAAATSSRKLT